MPLLSQSIFTNHWHFLFILKEIDEKMFIGNVDYQETAKAAMVDIQKVKTTIKILKPQKNRSPFFSGPATKRRGGV